jgi:ABC-type transport system involved in multi-copper enzyme maturation permease subunit
MNEPSLSNSFWTGVAAVWRWETRRLWTWKRVLGLLGLGLLTSLFVAVLSLASWGLLVARSGERYVAVVWDWVSSFLGLYSPLPPWLQFLGMSSLSSDHWLRSEAITAYFLAGYPLHVLQHYFLPAIAGRAITGEQEQRRLDFLRLTALQPSELLIGKGLGVLTPFLIFWLPLTVWPLTWAAFTGVPGDFIMLSLASYLLSWFTIALLGLCASACCRRSSTATVVAYLLAWGVPMLVGWGLHWVLFRGFEFDTQAWGDSYARMMELSFWSSLCTSLLVIIPTFLVACRCLRQREGDGG